ncbi:hypothetical protein TrVE_jg11440 [Triparma verrucosa]|uniref:NADPH:adrenodoxin oxidoreductase, mitochondrial n=1 Tax=Triparma verrucosa TaxID=1606542 RepID=A0A9W7KRD4_9STRA|nr:hypothetical protein TrVE_jg11440 [Triparma verrucosa]
MLTSRISSLPLKSILPCSHLLSPLRIPTRSLNVAIIGSGPSGGYALKYLLSSPLNSSNNLRINVFDKCHTPWGLLRSGVAPDHQDVKNASNDFEAAFEREEVKFYGGVEIGKTLKLHHLTSTHKIIILSHGCSTSNFPSLTSSPSPSNVIHSKNIVDWYNGVPGVIGPILNSKNGVLKVTIIGGGNVTLDISRILLKSVLKCPSLEESDIVERAFERLRREVGRVEVRVLNRRGGMQTAFTIKEFRDLTKMTGEDMGINIKKEDIEKSMNEESLTELDKSRPLKRLWKLLSSVSSSPTTGTIANLSIEYFLNPYGYTVDPSTNTVTSVKCRVTELEGEPFKQKPKDTDVEVDVETDLVVWSTGYKGEAIEGLERYFDNGVYRCEGGRVGVEGGCRLYACGWIRRGAVGIVGTNIQDARETVRRVVEDFEGGEGEGGGEGGGVEEVMREEGVEWVDWEGWKRIDEVERRRERKRVDEQIREKIVDVDEMMKIGKYL